MCRHCRGAALSRREFLAAASVGGAALSLPLAAPSLLRAEEPVTARGKAKACILLWMAGGPSQFETFDPKPGTATGGPVRGIATSADGVQISEFFPQLAKQARRVAFVRSLTHKEGDHDRATHLVHTGRPPGGPLVYPSVGSVVGSLLGPVDERTPAYVTVGNRIPGPGFLGVDATAFPIQDPNRPPEHLTPPASVPAARQARRADFLDFLQQQFAASHPGVEAEQHRALYRQAGRLSSPDQRKLFDLATEPPSSAAAYGAHPFGRACLLARRLVEAGVRFVEVSFEGWDTHADNFNATRSLAGASDVGFAALIADLAARGRLDETLVVWAGEFGRTPGINGNRGRDHFPAAACAAFAGGGVPGGIVVGKTSADGTEIADAPVTVPSFLATIYKAMGISPDKRLHTPDGRPIPLVEGGRAVPELAG